MAFNKTFFQMDNFFFALYFKRPNQFEACCFNQSLSYFYFLLLDAINSSLIKWNALIIAFLGDKHFVSHYRAIEKETKTGQENDG